uniref:O-acetylhomoserine aminocarboxypropyltransferase n=1 Tax=Odontella aurita TaxID=265563 RepID=A0A7S4JBP9_9STRA
MFNNLLPQLGIEVRFVDMNEPDAFANAVDDNTRAFFCESVTNPSLEIADIERIAQEARGAGLPLIVDSTFSTPYLCKPFEFGADIITNSLTKWIGGHGACLGGIIVDKGTFDWGAGKHPLFDVPDTSYGGEDGLRWGHDLPEALAPLAFKLRALTVPLRNFGGCLSADNAWIIIQGIETLSLRMERHCENALAVAEHLESHPKVAWVRYPGMPHDPQYDNAQKYLRGKGGSMVVFGIDSDDPLKAGQQFIDNLELFSHVANVGDCKSLAIHPATTTHSQLRESEQRAAGVSPDLVRLSIGVEDVDDIIKDLDDTLEKVA